MGKVREIVLPAIERQGSVEAWIIDDTGFPKQGRHSVGVARQYCGQLGKQDNCQVAVSLSLANRHASLPVAWRSSICRPSGRPERAELARERKELSENAEFELDEIAEIYVKRGVDQPLARQVAQQLMAKDALTAHARDELGISE